MRPTLLTKGLFVGGVGCLLVSVLLSINDWPAAELFSIIGALSTTVLYVVFNRYSGKRSNHARHAVLGSLMAAIVLRSFGLAAGSWFLLMALIATLVWLVWSVLEELPSAGD